MKTNTPTLPWRAIRCFQNNGPDYWIVADKAFKGNVLAQCDSEEKAMDIVRAVNAHSDLLQAVKDALLLAQLHDLEGAAIDNYRRVIAKAEGK